MTTSESTRSTQSTPSEITPQPGKLGNSTTDSMALHTREALRVFNGRAANTKAKVAPMAGGRHFAAALKSIWYLSGADNPYADWVLIRVYDGLMTLRARVAALTAAREAVITDLQRKGLTFAVLESASPVTVALGFRSPYGYAVAEAMVEFDYYVRVVQTLVQKDRLTDAQGRAEIRALSHGLFTLFQKAMRWERLLLREDLQPLCRADFQPDANDLARQRVMAAAAALGKLPRNVLLGSELPRHTKRRVPLSSTKQAAMTGSSPALVDWVDLHGPAAADAAHHFEDSPPGAQSSITNNVSRETVDTLLEPPQ